MMSVIKNFLVEKAKWTDAGCPVRTKQRIEELHSICNKCPLFEQGKGFLPGYDRCSLCGCNLHPTSKTLNKLAWGTTQCPDNPPRWGPEEPLLAKPNKKDGSE